MLIVFTDTMVQFPCAANGNYRLLVSQYIIDINFACSTGFLDATIVYALGAVCAVLVVCITVCLCAFCLKYCKLLVQLCFVHECMDALSLYYMYD